MTLTRCKLLAGVLGVSMAGLAATAQVPNGCPAPSHAARLACDLPPIPTVQPPELLQASARMPIPIPQVVEVVPMPSPLELPAPQILVPIEMPVPPLPPKLELQAVPEPQRPVVNVAAKPQTAATAKSASFRVFLELGAGSPRVEVLSGDDALLKVVCERIEVRTPGDSGTAMTPLKASGSVKFSAPGCDGTCDDLTVLPTTGEVILHGDVKVRFRRGKAETEMTGTTVKFKLGSAPAYAVPEPVTAASHLERP